ncbi:hypothetical protein ACHAWF_009203 [Thalassiosira exigua]
MMMKMIRPTAHTAVRAAQARSRQRLCMKCRDLTRTRRPFNTTTTRELNGETSQDTSRTMYNKQANNWARTEPCCLSDFTGRPVVFDMLKEVLGEGESDKLVLDVGCGEGYCARKVIELGATKVIGTDISKEMIHGAKQASEGDSRFQFYVSPVGDLLSSLRENASALGLKTGEEEFDVAMAVFVFNYLTTDDMDDAIAQMYETLKPGGTFVFSVPHPSMIFCHDSDVAFRLDSEGKGYYTSRNEKLLGQITRIDGTKLNVMSVHKIFNDYMKAINEAGFQLVDVREAGVTEEHMQLHPEFFESVKDRPLHLIFRLMKPLN